jgi:NAD(P)-dependent dehydrogenase (short-subunit alcohol dehydrogenase family)
LHVVVAGRSQDKLERVAREIEAEGGKAYGVVTDATNEEQVQALFDTSEQYGTLNAVLHNVGNNAIIPFEDLDAKTFELFWRVGCFAGFLTAKAALPKLMTVGGGTLLFTGASASMRGRPNFAHFAAAKAGLRNLAQALARDFGPRGIHVGHVVVDGVIDGEMVRSRFGEYLEQLGPDGSINPDEMAEAFWAMHVQPRSAWTHELDIRPFKEVW